MVGNERRKLAVTLKFNGHTYAEIGRMLGLSTSAAQQLVKPTTAVTREVYTRFGYRCVLCKRGSDETVIHIHHRGKATEPWQFNHISNLCPLCPSCHANHHAWKRKQPKATQ